MSDVTVVIVVVVVGLIVVGAVMALISQLRRRGPSTVLDEDAVQQLVSRLTAAAPAPTPVPAQQDQDAVSGLRAEANEVAAEIRRAAAEAAEAVDQRAKAEADRVREQARVEAQRTLAEAAAEAARSRSQVEADRARLAQEAESRLEDERAEVRQTQQRVVAETETVRRDRQDLIEDRARLGRDRTELDRVRDQLAERDAELKSATTALDRTRTETSARSAELDRRASELEEIRARHERELARISSLTVEQARAELLASQEDAIRQDAAVMMRRIESEAEQTAKTRARAIVAEAVQRVASDQTAQTVVSVVHLPAEEVKGRIIGREGRNIRTFEQVTGVNVIIDDTPEAVLLSCFDPVRREIGRVTLQMLIDDGRIHPHRIEEAYERAGDEVEALCLRAAEDALIEVGITDLHPELVKLIGHLKYRTSYGQNVLGHLVETSHIARVMAAELGLDPRITARGAFLHDIGKALTHEARGSHAIVGAELARRFGESEDVAHCIEAHHDEVSPTTVEAVLTQAADSCSGGRPGARRESIESYVNRLEKIEAIASAKKGVEKVFAMQAGRELRIMVKPETIDDLEAHVLAREVAKQIEEELTYPGQVRVTVIRESRATEIAR